MTSNCYRLNIAAYVEDESEHDVSENRKGGTVTCRLIKYVHELALYRPPSSSHDSDTVIDLLNTS
jgi:hypothetical protein